MDAFLQWLADQTPEVRAGAYLLAVGLASYVILLFWYARHPKGTPKPSTEPWRPKVYDPLIPPRLATFDYKPRPDLPVLNQESIDHESRCMADEHFWSITGTDGLQECCWCGVTRPAPNLPPVAIKALSELATDRDGCEAVISPAREKLLVARAKKHSAGNRRKMKWKKLSPTLPRKSGNKRRPAKS